MMLFEWNQSNFIYTEFVSPSLISIWLRAHWRVHSFLAESWPSSSAAPPRTDWQIRLNTGSHREQTVQSHMHMHMHTGTYFLTRIARWKDKYWYLRVWLSMAIMNIKGRERRRKPLTDTAVNTTVQTRILGRTSVVRSDSCRCRSVTRQKAVMILIFPLQRQDGTLVIEANLKKYLFIYVGNYHTFVSNCDQR